jgi:cystathionine beta-lyase/cystathionine gamma-synthase
MGARHRLSQPKWAITPSSAAAYGKTLSLRHRADRLGIAVTMVDTCDLTAVKQALQPNTKLLVAETIANPLLEVADIAALAELAHRKNTPLLIDNTFASPILCRPLELGADLVMESLTKTLNGHSDVILGFLGGREDVWERVPTVISTWGPPAARSTGYRPRAATAHLA